MRKYEMKVFYASEEVLTNFRTLLYNVWQLTLKMQGKKIHKMLTDEQSQAVCNKPDKNLSGRPEDDYTRNTTDDEGAAL